MNEKTAQQIENMKSQTYGVEVEMTGIERPDAAKLASEFFGTGRCRNTVSRHGHSAWSAWDTKNREWQFVRDISIDTIDAERCELVSPPLIYDEMGMLQELIRQFRRAGAESNPDLGCGIHVSIGAEGQTPQTLRNLVNLMASHEVLIVKALDVNLHRINKYSRLVDDDFLDWLNDEKPGTMADLAEIWYRSQGASHGRNFHYNNSRYHMLNLHCTFTRGIIEFRCFQFDPPCENRKGGLHAGQLKSYIQFCLALCQKAKVLKKVSPKPLRLSDPEHEMNLWLTNLCMVGDEFATARNTFTRKFTGSSDSGDCERSA